MTVEPNSAEITGSASGTNREPFTRTNKAEFFRLDNGSLLKQYLPDRKPTEKVLQDQRSLQFLEQAFGQVHHDGWVYRTVKLLGLSVERREVCLEFVSGDVLSEVCKSKFREAESHCGIWLALYHDKLLGGATNGLIFWDFNVHNVIIDFEEQTVVAIDPGMRWGNIGNAYQDLVRHIHSCLVTLVAKGKAPPLAILSFLEGYARTTQNKPKLLAYYHGLWREIRRQFYLYSRKSYLKLLFYPLILGITFPLYFCLIPLYLKLRYRGPAGNPCAPTL